MSEQVREMFSSIAPRYDVTNQVLSFGIHHRWRKEAVKRSGVVQGNRVLDCATGTGDLAFEFRRAVGEEGEVVGTDFCAPMLVEARRKAERLGYSLQFERADALALPYENARFDAASIAFGIRNVDDPLKCLQEMARVVRPGGRVVVLEFGQPRGFFGGLYSLYSRAIMPTLGGLLTGNRAAFQYLPRTARAFPAGERFLQLMQQAQVFSSVEVRALTFGMAYVYTGVVG